MDDTRLRGGFLTVYRYSCSQCVLIQIWCFPRLENECDQDVYFTGNMPYTLEQLGIRRRWDLDYAPVNVRLHSLLLYSRPVPLTCDSIPLLYYRYRRSRRRPWTTYPTGHLRACKVRDQSRHGSTGTTEGPGNRETPNTLSPVQRGGAPYTHYPDQFAHASIIFGRAPSLSATRPVAVPPPGPQRRRLLFVILSNITSACQSRVP